MVGCSFQPRVHNCHFLSSALSWLNFSHYYWPLHWHSACPQTWACTRKWTTPFLSVSSGNLLTTARTFSYQTPGVISLCLPSIPSKDSVYLCLPLPLPLKRKIFLLFCLICDAFRPYCHNNLSIATVPFPPLLLNESFSVLSPDWFVFLRHLKC